MNSGAIEPLLYLLDDPISEVRLNALKVKLVLKSVCCVSVGNDIQ